VHLDFVTKATVVFAHTKFSLVLPVFIGINYSENGLWSFSERKYEFVSARVKKRDKWLVNGVSIGKEQN
jgi:hypothetical protein